MSTLNSESLKQHFRKKFDDALQNSNNLPARKPPFSFIAFSTLLNQQFVILLFPHNEKVWSDFGSGADDVQV